MDVSLLVKSPDVARNSRSMPLKNQPPLEARLIDQIAEAVQGRQYECYIVQRLITQLVLNQVYD